MTTDLKPLPVVPLATALICFPCPSRATLSVYQLID